MKLAFPIEKEVHRLRQKEWKVVGTSWTGAEVSGQFYLVLKGGEWAGELTSDK